MSARFDDETFAYLEDPAYRRRVRATVTSTDSDFIPKVAEAGEVIEIDGTKVQIMHNGLRVLEGTYDGQWLTDAIRLLRGHHEPQEEAVFHRILERLAAEGRDDYRMVEFGAFWSYYSMWFARHLPGAQVLAMEPDSLNLSVGRRNVELNDLGDQIEFMHAVVGDRPGEMMTFSDNHAEPEEVVQIDFQGLLDHRGWDRVDLALIDIQGFETPLLEQSRTLLEGGGARFLVISTHHHAFSGDLLTHQKCLDLVREYGGTIIAEHSVAESASGDGLIAVSFDERDREFTVEISYARSKESMFGELEYEIAAREAHIVDLNALVDILQHEVAKSSARADELERQIAAVKSSRTWRAAAPLRRLRGE